MKKLLTLALALVALAGFTSLGAAQERRALPIDGPPIDGHLSLPCCRCIGDEEHTLNLSTGVAGVPWSVTPGSGPTATTLSAWGPISGASWIQPVSSSTPDSNVPKGSNTYTVTFNVPKCVIPYEKFTLTGSYGADNGAEVHLDTNPPGSAGSCTPSPPATDKKCFASPQPLNWSGTLIPGPHTLNVVVKNEGGYSGLAMNAKLTGSCTKKATLP